MWHKKHSKKINNFLAILTVFTFFVFSYSQVKSNSLDNVSGFAWNADQEGADEPGGMGWLSFNCISGGACGAVDYGVNIDADGNMSGYAWTSNYGWLKFGGLSGFPTGGGTESVNARVDMSSGKLSGWARFCAPASNPSTCLGNGASIKTGGWDGWLSLSGDTLDGKTYGVTLDIATGDFSGFAWGGDDAGKNVVGWVDFDLVQHSSLSGPNVSLTATPISIPSGSSTVLTWEGLNLLEAPDSCDVTSTPNITSWTGKKSYPMPTDGVDTGALSVGTYTFTISCLGIDGITYSPISSVDVIVGSAVSLDFYASPNPVYPDPITKLYTTTLNWNAVPSSPGLTTCVADTNPPLNIAPISEWNGPVSNTPGTLANVPVPYSPTKYKLTCKDAGGNDVSKIITVVKGIPVESVALSNTDVVETPAGSGTYKTTLSWATVNVKDGSCHPSSANPPSVPSWISPDPKSPTLSGSQSGVIVPAVPPAFTIYTLTCEGLYSNTLISVDLKLNKDSKASTNKKQPKYKEN